MLHRCGPRVTWREMPSVATTLVAAATALVWVASASCPPTCTCRWKNGKETVECVGAGLTSLPAGVQVGTQVLDLSGNSLHALPKDMFVAPGLLNLQRIYLASCKIGRVDDLAFSRLSNLVELDLSNNLLTAVPSEAFRDFTSLRRLVLSDNPITRVESDAFVYLPVLTTLEMSRCRVDTVMPRAFDGLPQLTSLKLDDNRLAHMPSRALAQLRALHGVELHGNLWKCDCHLTDLRQWLLAGGVPYGAPLVCSSPDNLLGLRVEQIPQDQLACSPTPVLFQPRRRQTEAETGDSVSLLCQVSAVPEPLIRWLWQGRSIANLSGFAHRPQVFVIRENGTTVKASVLTMTSVDQEDTGDYHCVAENSAGRLVTNFTLVINPRNTEEVVGFTGTQVAGIGVGLVVMALVIVLLLWVLVERWRHTAGFGGGKAVTVNKMNAGKLSHGVHQPADLHIDREQYELKSSLPHANKTSHQPNLGFNNEAEFSSYERHLSENIGEDQQMSPPPPARCLSNQPDVIIVNGTEKQCQDSNRHLDQCLHGWGHVGSSQQKDIEPEDTEPKVQMDMVGTESKWKRYGEWMGLSEDDEDQQQQSSWDSPPQLSMYDVPKLSSPYSWQDAEQPLEYGEHQESPSASPAFVGVTNPFGHPKNPNYRFRNLVPVLPPFPPQRLNHSPDEGYEGDEGTEV